MSSLISNLINLATWLFAGPWQVAPWPVGVLAVIVIAAASAHRIWSRSNIFLLGAGVTFAAALLHIVVITLNGGLGPLTGLGFAAGLIAFYPVALVALMAFRRLSRR